VPFVVRPADVEELEQGEAHAVALENARRKAAAVEAQAGELVLGVDTVVTLDGTLYGKPPDEGDARRTLSALGGRTHAVVSALALRGGESGVRTVTAATNVTFRTLSDALLEWYLAAGEWRDRAGGYAIQGRGAALVRAIEGDYLNVVGLPVPALLELEPDLVARAPENPSLRGRGTATLR
jgi:septum formation protein